MASIILCQKITANAEEKKASRQSGKGQTHEVHGVVGDKSESFCGDFFRRIRPILKFAVVVSIFSLERRAEDAVDKTTHKPRHRRKEHFFPSECRKDKEREERTSEESRAEPRNRDAAGQPFSNGFAGEDVKDLPLTQHSEFRSEGIRRRRGKDRKGEEQKARVVRSRMDADEDTCRKGIAEHLFPISTAFSLLISLRLFFFVISDFAYAASQEEKSEERESDEKTSECVECRGGEEGGDDGVHSNGAKAIGKRENQNCRRKGEIVSHVAVVDTKGRKQSRSDRERQIVCAVFPRRLHEDGEERGEGCDEENHAERYLRNLSGFSKTDEDCRGDPECRDAHCKTSDFRLIRSKGKERSFPPLLTEQRGESVSIGEDQKSDVGNRSATEQKPRGGEQTHARGIPNGAVIFFLSFHRGKKRIF